MYPTNYFQYEGGKLHQWWTTHRNAVELRQPGLCERGEWRDVPTAGDKIGDQNPLPADLTAAAEVNGTLPAVRGESVDQVDVKDVAATETPPADPGNVKDVAATDTPSTPARKTTSSSAHRK